MDGTEGILALAEFFKAGVILLCLIGLWYVYLKLTFNWRGPIKGLFAVGVGLPILTGGVACLVLRDWRWGLVFASPLIVPGIMLSYIGLILTATWLIPELGK